MMPSIPKRQNLRNKYPNDPYRWLQGAGIHMLLSPNRWHGMKRRWTRGRMGRWTPQGWDPRSKPPQINPLWKRFLRGRRLVEIRNWLHRKLRGLHVPSQP